MNKISFLLFYEEYEKYLHLIFLYYVAYMENNPDNIFVWIMTFESHQF